MNSLFKRFLLAVLAVSSLSSNVQAGAWTPLINPPPFATPIDPGTGGAGTCMLLTDGRILVQNTGWNFNTGEMWTLTPDINGSYVNGTWQQVASLPDGYIPFAYASAVLADGRVIFEGGELNGANYESRQTNLGAIYDPVENIWTAVEPPPFFNSDFPAHGAGNVIGDAASVVLSDGTFMLACNLSKQAALLDLKTMTWTETGTSTKADANTEEGWTLLPNGKVLTVDCYFPGDEIPFNPTNSELYDPKTKTWSSAGSTIVPLSTFPSANFPSNQPPYGFITEIGPQVLRPDGTVACFGYDGHISIYDTKTGVWTPGPRFPVTADGQLGFPDGAGALLPNGNILVCVGAINDQDFGNLFGIPPAKFFIFDGASLIEQPGFANSSDVYSSLYAMVVLPTGEILCVNGTNDVEIFTSDDKCYHRNWAPRVSSAPKKVCAGKTYKIKGIRFNGMSQGAMFGDESQSATNYPLVRITNIATGHVFYCRTHDHSFMGVASKKKVTTYFDVPKNIESGKSKLEVVANGIPSKAKYIYVRSA
ncbi:MAG: hypothetical protein LLF94_02265 [Chlamydiales bacterium]|nr:hypothetical protein [Chlamydiales bacterium]